MLHLGHFMRTPPRFIRRHFLAHTLGMHLRIHMDLHPSRCHRAAFDQMKLQQLKEELAARGSTRTARGAQGGPLQRRLHGLLVQAAIEARGAQDEEDAGTPPRTPRWGGRGARS